MEIHFNVVLLNVLTDRFYVDDDCTVIKKRQKSDTWTNFNFVNTMTCVSLFHSLDDSILHIDVSTEGLVIIHDLPSFDQETVALQKQKKRMTSQ